MVLMMILYASLGHKIAARYKAPSIPAETLFLVCLVVTTLLYFDRFLYAAMSKESCHHATLAIFVDCSAFQDEVCGGGKRSVHAGLIHWAGRADNAALPDRKLTASTPDLQPSRLFHVSQ